MSYSARVDPLDDGTSFDIRSSVVGATNFTVKTLHLSCKSDAYQRREHKYGGIIIYGRNGQGDWRTANGTHCKSGYVVIMQTDTTAFKDLQTKWNEPGKVHGIIYRKAFGESLKDPEVTAVGEGFGIQYDTTTKSGSLNPASDGYHDYSLFMHEFSGRCVKALVEIWKQAGPGFPAKQNYDVKELLEAGMG